MTEDQEEAFYDFLIDAAQPFSLKDVVTVVKRADSTRNPKLSDQVSDLLKTPGTAFFLDGKWLSRRGFFEKAKFIIMPTRLELLNGILIPGHRLVPFARPDKMPNTYTFFWHGRQIPATTTEGPAEDFYPYYSIFGEEYAPQYIFGDTKENETALSEAFFDDGTEVSINTVDMRNVYRREGFVPGDQFAVTIRDWKKGSFNLEKIPAGDFDEKKLAEWQAAMEDGFEKSFKLAGPLGSTEEQIAFAYWFGKPLMMRLPAYSLEYFLFEKTNKIETVAFGIESRFWQAGKDIPDYKKLTGLHTQTDLTPIEGLLWEVGVPISEYVIQGYVRDALYHKEKDIDTILVRIIPPSIEVERWVWNALAAYVIDAIEENRDANIEFTDKQTAPIRRRLTELHTAVIELATKLSKGEINSNCLPRHTFIILSQIQIHCSSLLEDVSFGDGISLADIDAIDTSIESMLDTYEEIKEAIDSALNNFRKTNITLVKSAAKNTDNIWQTIQLSIGGTDIWRRLNVPEVYRMEELAKIIPAVFSWSGELPYRFVLEFSEVRDLLTRDAALKMNVSIAILRKRSVSEVIFEYSKCWTVKVIFLGRFEAEPGSTPCCIAGECAPPPENVEGPLRYRRFLSALEQSKITGGSSGQNDETFLQYMDKNFDPDYFNKDAVTEAILKAIY